MVLTSTTAFNCTVSIDLYFKSYLVVTYNVWGRSDPFTKNNLPQIFHWGFGFIRSTKVKPRSKYIKFQLII